MTALEIQKICGLNFCDVLLFRIYMICVNTISWGLRSLQLYVGEINTCGVLIVVC